MSNLQNVWKSCRNTICGGLALFVVAPANASPIPAQCNNTVYRIASPTFASACDAASSLDGQINAQVALLNKINGQVDSDRQQIQNEDLVSKYWQSQIKTFTDAISGAQQTIQADADSLKSLADAGKTLVDSQTKLEQTLGVGKTELTQDIANVNVIIQQNNAANPLIDQATSAFLSGVKQLGVNTSISLGTLETDYSLTLNPITGTVWFDATLPGGWELSTTDLAALMAGTYAVPPFNPVQVAIEDIPVSTTNTSDWTEFSTAEKNKHEEQYISSRRFTDFFGEDQFGSDAISALLTGGESVPGSLDRAKEYLVLEWSDYLAWAKITGQRQLEAASGSIFENVIHDQTTNLSLGPSISTALTVVPYNYTISFDASKLNPLVANMTSSVNSITSFSTKDYQDFGNYSFDHLGFATTINGFSGPTPKDLVTNLFAHGLPSFNPISEVTRVANLGGLSSSELQWLSSIIPNDLGLASSGTNGIFNSFFPKIAAANLSDLQQSITSKVGDSYVVDLTGTTIATNLNTQMQGMFSRLGGNASVTSLDIDLRTGRISAAGKLSFDISVDSVVTLTQNVDSWSSDKKGMNNLDITNWNYVLQGANVDYSKVKLDDNFQEMALDMSNLKLANSINTGGLTEVATKIASNSQQYATTLSDQSGLNTFVQAQQNQLDTATTDFNAAQKLITSLTSQLSDDLADYNTEYGNYNNLLTQRNGIPLSIPNLVTGGGGLPGGGIVDSGLGAPLGVLPPRMLGGGGGQIQVTQGCNILGCGLNPTYNGTNIIPGPTFSAPCCNLN